MIVLDKPHQIRFAQMCAWRGALRLELLGMKHSSGCSVYAIVKRELGLTGNRKRVYAQLDAMIRAHLPSAPTGDAVN